MHTFLRCAVPRITKNTKYVESNTLNETGSSQPVNTGQHHPRPKGGEFSAVFTHLGTKRVAVVKHA